jgi:undecaprenyl-phosphate 4-deoxy-4-formamido-L-arabinose transferase
VDLLLACGAHEARRVLRSVQAEVAMSATRPDVSVVVPVLNEADTVVELVERVAAVLGARQKTFEIVCIDDGSTDATVSLLRGIERDDPSVRVFEFTRNFGQAAALACGLREARGDVVVTMDGDLQNPPEEIPKLLAVIAEGAAIATARRSVRYEHTWRWLGSRFVHWLARVLLQTRIEDFGGQFKAYRRDVIDATQKLWAPGKPFFPLAVWLGFPVCEVTVRHDPRRAGASRYSFASLVRINIDLITSFTTVPLVVLAATGAVGFVLGALAVRRVHRRRLHARLRPGARAHGAGIGRRVSRVRHRRPLRRAHLSRDLHHRSGVRVARRAARRECASACACSRASSAERNVPATPDIPAIEGGTPVRKTMLAFTRPSVGAEEERAVIEVLRSGWLTTGPLTERFERAFAGSIGATHAIGVSSCTAGLHLLLRAAGVGPATKSSRRR